MIQAQLEDGRILEFPDDTDPQVVEATVKKMVGQDTQKPSMLGVPSAAGGMLESAATMMSSIGAEPVAGLAGLAATPFVGSDEAANIVKDVKRWGTYQPQTKKGKEYMGNVAAAIKPLGRELKATERMLGEATEKATGSPALAAAAATFPTAIMEILGVGLGKKAAQLKTGFDQVPELKSLNKVSPQQVDTALLASAPDVSKLKDYSRAIYKEIADSGSALKPEYYQGFVNRVIKKADDLRVNKRRTPEATGVVAEFKKDRANPQDKTVLDMEDLRRIAGDLAGSNTKAEASVGMSIIDEIDSFMDAIPSQAFTGEAIKNTGAKYKAARNMWGRARRAEMISEAMDKAGRQASGFENGIRVQLRQILNNKKRSRYFTKEELASMDQVVKGTSEQNISKLVGRLGFSEGQATNILGGMSGTLLGSQIGGPLGAAGINAIGQYFRGRAQKITAKNAALSDAVVKSNSNAREIVEAYLRTTKKPNLNELSDLLTDPRIDVTDILGESNKLVKEAAEIARGRKIYLQTGLAGTAPGATMSALKENADE